MEQSKKELTYFHIEHSFGGNQDWFTDHWMHIGGCAALAACDSCISLEASGMIKGIYPYDIQNLTRDDYLAFGMKMKPYLRPRFTGIDKLEIYIDGMRKYLSDRGCHDLSVTGFSSDLPVEEAKEVVRQQIEAGYPIPYLLLRHNNPTFKDLHWHWFMLTGYQEYNGEMYVKETTYGDFRWLSFEEMWDSGYKKNGGMIVYQ